jgi:hypothetical protein
MAKPKVLVTTVRVGTPIESADVPALLARLAGDDGVAELLVSDIRRGTIEQYRDEVDARKLAKKERPSAPAVAAKPGPKRAAKRAAAKATIAKAG